MPPVAAAALVPGLETPQQYRAIVNAHFRMAPPDVAPMTGVINGTVEWIFAFADRLSVTISERRPVARRAARRAGADACGKTCCKALQITADLPPWQIVRERRATFAATPEQNARRPAALTPMETTFFWPVTGRQPDCPRRLESAVRSGFRAADLVDGRAGGTP